MKTKNLVLTAMLTAVLAVLSIIQIPMPSGVPITLQTFAVALCGYVLGSKYGTLAALLYVILGAIGVPVYSGMTAGVGVLFGMPGGFLFGFIPMAFLCGLGLQRKQTWMSFFTGMAGLVICHLFGVIQFSLVSQNSLGASFFMVSAPYLIKDILSVIGAAFASMAIRRGLAQANMQLS